MAYRMPKSSIADKQYTNTLRHDNTTYTYGSNDDGLSRNSRRDDINDSKRFRKNGNDPMTVNDDESFYANGGTRSRQHDYKPIMYSSPSTSYSAGDKLERNDMINASSSKDRLRGSSSRADGNNFEYHRDVNVQVPISTYSRRNPPHRRHSYSDNYSRYYYNRRNPNTGRFINASRTDIENDMSPVGADKASSTGRGFFNYLKDALASYSPDINMSSRKKHDDIEYRRSSRSRKEKKNRYYEGYDPDDIDTNEQDQVTYEDNDDQSDDRSNYKKRRSVRGGGKNNISYDNYRGRSERNRYTNTYDQDGEIYGDSHVNDTDHRYPLAAGGTESCRDTCYTFYDEQTCDGREIDLTRAECKKVRGCSRPRSLSLKAGGKSRKSNHRFYTDREQGNNQNSADNDGDPGPSKRYRDRNDNTSSTSTISRGRRRSRRSVGVDSSRERPDVSLRDIQLNDTIASNDISEQDIERMSVRPSGSGRRRFGRQKVGKNAYVPPSAMMSEPDEPNPCTSNTRTVPRRRVDSFSEDERVLPPFIEGRISVSEYIRLMPLERMMISYVDKGEDEDEWLAQRLTEFGRSSYWREGSRADYDPGNMYCADPGGQTATWRRTAMQANALVSMIGKDALRDSVLAVNMEVGTAVVFLADAAMRMSSMFHADPDEVLPKWNPLPDVLRKLPMFSAPLLMDGPTSPARGATSSILRSHYGVVAYWPSLRSRVVCYEQGHVRYAVMNMHRANVYMASRACKSQTTLTDFELQVASACFTAGLVAAAVEFQFLYTVVSKSLHPKVKKEQYKEFMDVSKYVKYPMGSSILSRVETACFSTLEDNGDVATGLAGSLIGAHVACRSAFTELMMNYVEESFDDDSHYELGGENTHTVVVGGMLLQLLMGHLNKLAIYLVIAALYHGRKVKIYSNAFKLYKYICLLCSPLYRPIMVSEFEDDREKALHDLGLIVVTKKPPEDINTSTLTPIYTSEIDALRLGTIESYDALGDIVYLSEALENTRDIIFGEETVTALKSHISGYRPKFGTNRNMRNRNYRDPNES